MIEKVYLYTDGTIDVFDDQQCRMLDLCGNWDALHYINACIKCKSPSQLPIAHRPSALLSMEIRDSVSSACIPITKNKLDSLLKYIKPVSHIINFDEEYNSD